MEIGQLNFEERSILPGFPDKIPYPVVWRGVGQLSKGLHSEYTNAVASGDRARSALASIALAAHKIRKADSAGNAEFVDILSDIDSVLVAARVEVESPEEGIAYEGALLDRFENVAQVTAQEESSDRVMRIFEIITPAVIIEGALVITGKASISIPLLPGDGAPAKN